MLNRLCYRLSDLATFEWDCSVDDLIHLGILDQAQICANVFRLKGGGVEKDRSIPPGLADRESQPIPGGLVELLADDLHEMDSVGYPYELRRGLTFDGNSWRTLEFGEDPIKIGPGHLCILPAEKTRLELELFRMKATTPPKTRHPTTSGLETRQAAASLKSLLLLLAAACNEADIDPREPGAAARLKSAVNSLDGKKEFDIDEATVLKYLRQIPQVVTA